MEETTSDTQYTAPTKISVPYSDSAKPIRLFLGKACPNVRCFLIPSNRRFNDSAATGGGVKPSFIRYHFGYCWHMSLPPAHAALLCAQ